MFEENNFTQTVNFKTRTENVLDLVFIRNRIPIVAKDHTFDSLFDVPHHKAVSISFDLTTYETKHPIKKYFSFSRADFDSIGTKILNHPLEFTFFSNINNMCLEFYKYVDKMLLEFVPQRTFHRQGLPPWITPETFNLMIRKHTKSNY